MIEKMEIEANKENCLHSNGKSFDFAKLDSSSALARADPEVLAIHDKECNRQLTTIELIASENYAHPAVLEALSSAFQNKYSEGRVGNRYYGGNRYVDEVESLCQQRALDLFGLNGDVWDVLVQSLSGSVANFTVFAALAGPNGKILGMSLPDGGHLTHGHAVSMTSKFFQSLQYNVDLETGLIDYDKLEEVALAFEPNVIIAGISAYSRELDYARFRKIADKCGALLMADMAHISGLLAGKVLKNNPFDYADVVTSTTHKTLRGPRGALVFTRKEKMLHTKVLSAHFPGLTGGPHNNKITALTVALKLANSENFKSYAQQMVSNARKMAELFMNRGFRVLTGGTDVHMIVVDLTRNTRNNINGLQVQLVADKCNISLNMNTIPGDKSPLRPSGLRIGVPQITTRGLKECDVVQVANLIFEAIELTESIKASLDSKEIKPTKATFISEMANFSHEMAALGSKATKFIVEYPIH